MRVKLPLQKSSFFLATAPEKLLDCFGGDDEND
jgi:hypothetical protein